MKYNEQELQIQLVKYLRIYRRPQIRFWHTNNNPKSAKDGARLKRMGMIPGIADFLFLAPDQGFFSLELKTERGRPSPEQLDWRDFVRDCGFYSEIAQGWNHAEKVLKLWGLVGSSKNV